MTYEDFRKICLEKRSLVPVKYHKIFDKELKYAKRYYDNGRDLFEELNQRRPQTKSPLMFALGFVSEIEDKKLEMVQVHPGSSGGI